MIDSNQVSQYQTAYDRAYKKYQRNPDSKEGKEFLKQAINAQLDMADLFPEEPGKENFERNYHLKRAEELISILEAMQPEVVRESEATPVRRQKISLLLCSKIFLIFPPPIRISPRLILC